MSPSEVKERRNYIRTATSVPLLLYLKKGKTRREVRISTRNISATGMMFEVEDKIPVGTHVKLELLTPAGANPVHCNGKVIWSSAVANTGRYYNGIEFTKIEEDNKNTFLKFLCDVIYKSSATR